MVRGLGGHSPSEVMSYLKGLDADQFPLDKQSLINQARQNGAEQEVMDVLEGMPDTEYRSMADVMQGVGAGARGDEDADAGGTHNAPVLIATYLAGVDLPCGRDDLTAQAEDNDAPEDVLDALRNLPDRQYGTMAEVEQAAKEAREDTRH